MSGEEHEVYVIYYEGRPCTGVNKPAYLTRGTANKVITDRAYDTVRWGSRDYSEEPYQKERAKYSVEVYTRKGSAE